MRRKKLWHEPYRPDDTAIEQVGGNGRQSSLFFGWYGERDVTRTSLLPLDMFDIT